MAVNVAVGDPKKIEKLGQPRRRGSHPRNPEEWARRAWWKRGNDGG